MNRDALPVRRFPVAFLLAALAALACSGDETAGPGDPGGDPSTTISATVVLSDVSQPAGPTAISGAVSYSGLTVELWNGEGWVMVSDGPTTASLTLADGTAQATLVSASEIRSGNYSRARLTAAAAAVDLSAMFDGRELTAQLGSPPGVQIVSETDVEVIVNDDGSRTFQIQVQTIRTITLQDEPGVGTLLVIDGDIGNASAPAFMRGGVVAADLSNPGVDVSGTIEFSGLTIELWDGENWLLVTDQPTTATLELGDGTAAATFVPVSAIPARTYSEVRLTATDVIVNVTAMLDGREYAAQFQPPTPDPVVIQKEVTTAVNADGSSTFSIELEMIRTIELQGQTLVIDGDLGSWGSAASMSASLVASDMSSPSNAALSGTVTFSGLVIELSEDGQDWLVVANEPGSATIALGDATASATLSTVDQIPAGTYTKIRLTANEAVVDVSVDLDGQQYAAQMKPPTDQPFVIVKDVEASVNEDGTTTLTLQLETIREIEIVRDPVSDAAIVRIDGDLGPAEASAG